MNEQTKILVGTIILLSAMASPCQAGSMTLTTYYPPPWGAYDRLKLIPRAPIAGNTCDIGTLYVNNADSNRIYYCQEGTGFGEWIPLAGQWQREDNRIFLSAFNPARPYNPNLLVGIRTTAPEFRLSIGDDGGILAKGAFDAGSILATQGVGTRMVWYPRKAAFRAGFVGADQWDGFNMGEYSTAAGYDTLAFGEGAVAFGRETSATGDGAFAIGRDTVASGISAIAAGNGTTASGQSSFAAGINSTASGDWSTAFGNATTASGNHSVAVGANTQATAEKSFAGGNATVASQSGALAFGVNSAASGEGSLAVGNNTQATGQAAFASGDGTLASGTASFASGRNTVASGSNSFAVGESTIASGNNSFAFGRGIEARGSNSFGIALANQTNNIIFNPNTMAIMGGVVGIGTLNPSHPLHMASGARIQGNGNICTAANVCLDTFSDERLKTDIEPLHDALDRMLRLRGVEFEWADPGMDPRASRADIQSGFLAQDVEKIFPQWVSENPDGTKVLHTRGFEALLVESLRQVNRKLEDDLRERMDRIEQLGETIDANQREIERLKKILGPAEGHP